MTRFSLVIIFFSFLFVRSDGQCSCSDLEFMKQLLQQEIFERKLEISKLRSEIQTSSNGHELIETDSFKGADTIIKRVDTLERRVIELENASSDGRKSETDENDAKVIRTQGEKDFQSIVRNTLKHEKMERVNFVENVQNQIEIVNEKMSSFMNTTDLFLEEQVNMLSANYENFENDSSKAFSEFRKSVDDLSQEYVTEMNGSVNLIKESMIELERNVSKDFEDFTIKITKTLNDKIMKTEAEVKAVQDDVTNLAGSVDNEVSTIGSLEADVGDLTAVVENSKVALSELQEQFKNHLTNWERLLKRVSQEIGTCGVYGRDWEQHGKKCYRFVDHDLVSWFDAKTKCESYKGELLKIDSKEENDVITKSVSKRKPDYWIGIHDTDMENVWQWSSSRTGNAHFTNWAPNEPNNYNNEDCGTIMTNGKWNDYSCYRNLPFICEAEPQL